ncbi:MAG: helix-turn-helix domain-containing protein [Adhaeribacter sp.]
MEHYTFEQLPQAISLLHEKISHIEQVLLERQPQPETEEVFNVSQAAAYLNLTVATLYTKVSRQEIPVNKRGKRLYFYKGELTQWIREGRQKTISEIQQEAQHHFMSRRRKSNPFGPSS